MFTDATNTTDAPITCTYRTWYIIGLGVRTVLIAALVLISALILPGPQSLHISGLESEQFAREAATKFLTQQVTLDDQWATLLKAAGIWSAWAVVYLAAMWLIGLHVRRAASNERTGPEIPGLSTERILSSAWKEILTAVLIVGIIVALRSSAGPYWILIWAAASAVWSIGANLLRTSPNKVLGLAVKGMATGPKADMLLEFLRANGGEGVRLAVLIPNNSHNHMQAAYVNRLRTQTIYLTSNMLESMDENELKAIVAHELGHHHRRRRRLYTVAAGFVMRVAVAFVAAELAFIGTPDPVAGSNAVRVAPFVFMYLWLLTWLLRPAVLAMSRRDERLTNAAAIALTGDPNSFVLAIKKLAASNGIRGEPSLLDRLLVQTHPSLAQVTAQARRAQGVA